MSTIRIYSRTVSDAMDFVRLLASMNYVNKQVSFQPARLPVYKLRIPEDRERGRSEHLLVQSLGAFKKTPTAYLRKEFDKPFYFTAISKGMGDPVLGQGEPVRLMSYKKYDIDVWIGADSRGEFKEKFLKGVALLDADTGECFGSITPEFMMDHALSLEDIEVGRGVRVDGTTFEVISAQEAADFKCLEIQTHTPKERHVSDAAKSISPDHATDYMASGSCRVRAYGTLDQLSQLKRDLADGLIASWRFDDSIPVMTAWANCSSLSYSALVRLRGIQKASLRTYGDQRALPFYFTARASRETSGLARARTSGYDIDIFCGAGSRREFITDRIRHKALLDPRTQECVGMVTPEFLMNHKISIEAIAFPGYGFFTGPELTIDGRTFEVISAQEAADFKCLEIPDRLPELHDKARLRALASTLHRTKRTKRTATTCARCGRKNLTRTIPVRLRNGSTAYLGSGCVRHVKIK